MILIFKITKTRDLAHLCPFLGGKLILKKVSSFGVVWDDVLPAYIKDGWKKWLASFPLSQEFSVRRSCFEAKSIDVISYQLHVFLLRV